MKAANNAKNLIPNINESFSTGWIPPKVINYVVAYDGPAQMSSVHSWILNSHKNFNIPLPVLNQQNRTTTAGTALDGVILLNKGFVKLDNSPLTFSNPHLPLQGTHIVSDSVGGNLLLMFLTLQEACDNVQGAWLNSIPYIQHANFGNLRIV